MAVQSGSYSSAIHGPRALARQAVNLVRGHTRDVGGTVATHVARLGEIERVVREHTGLQLSGLDVLDVGAGQRLIQLAYFSRRNRVTGIDRDVIVQGFEPLGYWRMLRTNGALRVAKTIARKAAPHRRPVPRRSRATGWTRALPPPPPGPHDGRRGDAVRGLVLRFVYSLTVLQHLEQPEQALEEIVRVMRPGAVVYVDLMPYTGRTGSLDIRVIGGGGGEPPAGERLRREPRRADRFDRRRRRCRLPFGGAPERTGVRVALVRWPGGGQAARTRGARALGPRRAARIRPRRVACRRARGGLGASRLLRGRCRTQ